MQTAVQTLILGTAIGGVYALMGVGLNLIFGVMRVANFAHGALYMIGGYAAYYLTLATGAPMPVAVLGAMAVGGCLGYFINAILLRPVYRSKIERPSEFTLIVTFALSLHAPDDGLRDELIPVNSRWKVDEALDAAREYFEKTGRRVSIEYALIKDMNDHGWRADLLAEKLNARGRGWVHVNPIPLNPTPGSIWTASEVDVQQEFVRRLSEAGIPTTIRDTRGKEIDGACGQLVATEEDQAAAARA